MMITSNGMSVCSEESFLFFGGVAVGFEEEAIGDKSFDAFNAASSAFSASAIGSWPSAVECCSYGSKSLERRFQC